MATHLSCRFVLKRPDPVRYWLWCFQAMIFIALVGTEGICHLAWTYAQRDNISNFRPCECQFWYITIQFARCVLGQMSVLSQYCSARGWVSCITYVHLSIHRRLFKPAELIHCEDICEIMWLSLYLWKVMTYLLFKDNRKLNSSGEASGWWNVLFDSV